MKSVVDILNNNYIDCFRMADPYPHIIFNEFFSNEESNILFEETKKIKKWNDISRMFLISRIDWWQIIQN